MPRFFRRLAEGVFDEDDVRRRAHELADFVDGGARAVRHRRAGRARLFERRQHRGGDVAAAARRAGRRDPAARHGAAAHNRRTADLAGKPVLIVSGQRDPIIRRATRHSSRRCWRRPAQTSSTAPCRPAINCRRPMSRSQRHGYRLLGSCPHDLNVKGPVRPHVWAIHDGPDHPTPVWRRGRPLHGPGRRTLLATRAAECANRNVTDTNRP